jgi:hypothetical protein
VNAGVISVAITGDYADRLEVIGDGVDLVCLVSCLRKKVGRAVILQVEPQVKDKKREEETKPAEKKSEEKTKPAEKSEEKNAASARTPAAAVLPWLLPLPAGVTDYGRLRRACCLLDHVISRK